MDHELADEVLHHLDPETRAASLQTYTPDGRVVSAGDGALAAAEVVPALRPLVRAVDLLRLRTVVRRLYWWVAARRGRLARFLPDVAAVIRPPRRPMPPP